MRKMLVVMLLAAVGCVGPTPDRSWPPADPGAALDGVANDVEHDNLAGDWVRRLHAQGKDRAAVEIASRIRDDRVRAATLADLQGAAGGR